jgi:hypothetical protein
MALSLGNPQGAWTVVIAASCQQRTPRLGFFNEAFGQKLGDDWQ